MFWELKRKTEINEKRNKKQLSECFNPEIIAEFLNLLQEDRSGKLLKIQSDIEKIQTFKKQLGMEEKVTSKLRSKRRA